HVFLIRTAKRRARSPDRLLKVSLAWIAQYRQRREPLRCRLNQGWNPGFTWRGLFRGLQSLIYRRRPRRKLGPILPASQEMARGFRTAMDFTHSFDIVLFAMIAAFLILRLRSVLGRRTGNERRRDPFVSRAEATGEKVVTLTPRPN